MSDFKTLQTRNEFDEISLKDIVREAMGLLSLWPILTLSMLLGLGVSYVINRYTEDKFKMSATVAVEESENPLASSEGMLNLWGESGILDTRIAVLKSFDHNLRVAQNLNLGVLYYTKAGFNIARLTSLFIFELTTTSATLSF